MAIVTIPLNTGCHEEADSRLMTDGRLRTVRNGRIDREGRIRVRAGYTALSMSMINSQTLIAYDIGSFGERLVVLGSANETDPGYAVDLFEYMGETHTQRWRPTSTLHLSPGEQRRLPSVTHMRDMNPMGDIPGGANFGCSAALDGYVVVACNARGDSNSGARDGGYVRIIKADTKQIAVQSNLPISANVYGIVPRAVAMSTKIALTAVQYQVSGGHTRKIVGWKYTPGGSSIGTSTDLFTIGANELGTLHASCSVANGDGLVIACINTSGTGNVSVRRFTSSLVHVTPSGGEYADIAFGTDPTAMVLEADAASDTLTVIAVVAGDLKIQSYTLSTGAVIGTPFYGATIQGTDDLDTHNMALGVCRYSASQILISMYVVRNTSPTSPDAVRLMLYTPATHAEPGTPSSTFLDCSPASGPIVVDGEVFIALRRGGRVVDNASDVVLCSAVLNTDNTPSDVVPQAAPDFGIAATFANLDVPLVKDAGTGYYYWTRLILDASLFEIPQVTEMRIGSTERRSMAELGGSLYISGGIVLHYDGHVVNEAGWLEKPVVTGVASNSTGNLDSSVTYTYVQTWESVADNGDVVLGPVSDPIEVVMGAADDTVTLSGRVPLSMRLNSQDVSQSSVRCKFWRNTVDDVSGTPTPSPLLQLVGTVSVDNTNFAGERVSFVDTMSDNTLTDQEILYTQSDSPLDNHAPQPSQYLFTANESIMATGQPRRERWQISKPLQPAQTVAWAQNGVLAFEGRVQRGEIQQAIGLAQSWMLATKRELLALNGSGPDNQGKGEFQKSYRIPSDGGMRDDGWKSAVVFGQGVMYQLEDDQMYLWAGGAPQPVGLEIQDTMLEFPNVVASCHVTGQQCVALALQNDAGDDGCIALWDQQTKQWYRDDVGAVDALAEYQGRLAYLQGGVVYLEDADYGTGTAPDLILQTGNCAKTGAAGASGVERILLTGVYQGDFEAELAIKYTDDTTYTSLGSVSFTASGDGYAAGDPFDQEWMPTRDDTSRFELQLTISGTTNSKLAWLNAIEVHYDPDDGPKRLGDARRR